MLNPGTLCWLVIAACAFLIVIIYWIELRKQGGMRLASPIAAAVFMYSAINPAMYLIEPTLARNYADLIGHYRSPDELLPGLLGCFFFQASLAMSSALVPRRTRKVKDKLEPLSIKQLRSMVLLAAILFFVGVCFFLIRNMIAYGELLGSFGASYKGYTARPQIAIFSSFTDIMSISVGIICVLILWQVKAKAWPAWVVLLPILIGALYAIMDGNRVILGTAIYFCIGWYSYDLRIKPKHAALILVMLSLFTLVANARYAKESTNFIERIGSIFNPEYFRPFWSGDPVGPSAVLTLEALRVAETGKFSFGEGYLSAIRGVLPSFVTGGHWVTPTVDFAARYQEEILKHEYIPGTGYAYSAIAEGYVNFGYPGVFLLGFLSGAISWKFIKPNSARCGRSSRLVFVYCFYFIVPTLARNSLSVFLSPLLISHIIIARYIYHLLRQE